jgi:hypothetical protein
MNIKDFKWTREPDDYTLLDLHTRIRILRDWYSYLRNDVLELICGKELTIISAMIMLRFYR